MNETPNKAIHCTVDECKYNCGKESYCSLNQISVSAHEKCPTHPQCVDCNSFEAK